MKPELFFLSTIMIFGSLTGKVPDLIYRNNTSETSVPVQGTAKSVEDVYVSFDYLKDADGYQYGAVFYLYNPNEYTMNIQWQFVGSVNVRFGPAISDRTVIPAKTKLWITTCTSIDRSKEWSSGKVQWKY